MNWTVWTAPAWIRHFPSTPPPRHTRPLRLEVARSETTHFQVVMRSDTSTTVRMEAEGPAECRLRLRRVGYVPVEHHNTPIVENPFDVEGLHEIPGYVPDPLFDETTLLLPAFETHTFWVTIEPDPALPPGSHSITVRVLPEQGRPVIRKVRLAVHDLVLEPRRNFDIFHWFYVDALIDWYQTDLFDNRFWPICERYIENQVRHGQNSLYVPIFTPPLDGVKRPSQLLVVRQRGEGRYAFDWTDVRRYVRAARRLGVEKFEWCHLFTQWGARHAIRIYEEQGRGEKLLWPPETPAVSPVYRRFLSQFLPEFHGFLKAEGLLDRSFFHLSDEPHGDEHLARYREARALLAELAPWMKVMDALSDIRFARETLTDLPIPSIQVALDFLKEGIPCACYYCCGPRGQFLNRLLDTPLAKIAMHGFLFYRWPFRAFLHWGYNYWYESQTRRLINPFFIQDGLRWARGWAYGDPFLVYPGSEGPVDSIRWEIFAESLQDYRLLQTLGVSRDDPLFQPIRSFETFPKDAAWRLAQRARLFRKAARACS